VDSDFYKRAQRLFDELADASPRERRFRLDALRQGEPELVAYVEKLLAIGDDIEGAGALDQALEQAVQEIHTDAALLHPGDEVGSYKALRRLGAGGMAEVWAVEHRVLGTRHALKVLLRASDGMRARLLREGIAQARLHHPNVVPVRDVIELAGVPALVMPLVGGPSLGALLRESPPPLPQALALFDGILDGVSHVHAAGMVHRDLKPDNILLEPVQGAWVPRVADFGLVKGVAATTATAAGVLMGTPAYAAPEQLRDASSVDARADLFSLGVLLVRLAAGHLPFPSADLDQIMASHAAEPDLRGLPEVLRPLATALLQRDPAQRLPTAALLRERLRALDLPRAVPAIQADAFATLQIWQTSSPRTEPPHTSQVVRHGVPRQRDCFVGRVDHLEALAARLLEARELGRLVTLTGTGGAGKTRLCAELAWSQALGWDHVWWVDLTEARDVAGVESAMARALGIKLRGDARESISTALGAYGRSLVILDNFEQVAQHSAATVGAWLDATEQTTFLTTSRVPLRLRGEQLLPLAPLSTADAAELFADRARAVGEEVSALDPAVIELVTLLDHLPLAIELAAACARARSPGAMVSRLSRRFQMLISRSPDLPERHRTLRGTLDWSWNLLSPEQQQGLAWCSVFEGSFTVEDAEAVLETVDPDLFVDDVLAALVEHSLLRPLGRGRLGMLVSVHAYAAEKRADRADVEAELLAAHAVWFARRGEALLPRLTMHFDRRVVEPFEDELNNLVAVVERLSMHQDGRAAALAALAAGAVFRLLGTRHRFVQLAEAILPAVPSGLARARLLGELGETLASVGEHERIRGELEEALRELGDAGNEALRSDLLVQLSGYVPARPVNIRTQLLEEALALQWSADALRNRGDYAHRQGDSDGAREWFQRALEQAEREPNQMQTARVLWTIGSRALTAGDLDGALTNLQQARVIAARERSFEVTLSIDLQLATLLATQGELERAEPLARAVAHKAAALGNSQVSYDARFALAFAQARRGHCARAACSLEELILIWRRQRDGHREIRELINLAEIRTRQGRLEEAEDCLRRLEPLAGANPVVVQTGVPFYRAQLLLSAGEAEQALALIAQLEPGATSQIASFSQLGLSTRAEALRQLGRAAEAAALLPELLAGARKLGDGVVMVSALLVQGRVLADLGRATEAKRAFEAATATARAAGARQEELRAVLERCRLPGAELVDLLERAAELQEGIDELPATARLRAELQAQLEA
jgi:serine/threonine protein kinase/predicted ATPase